MVSLEVVFNEEKAKSAGYTCEELMDIVRAQAEKNGVEEVSYGVFMNDTPEDLARVGSIVPRLNRSNRGLFDYMDKCILDVDGDKEDAKAAIMERNQRKTAV